MTHRAIGAQEFKVLAHEWRQAESGVPRATLGQHQCASFSYFTRQLRAARLSKYKYSMLSQTGISTDILVKV